MKKLFIDIEKELSKDIVIDYSIEQGSERKIISKHNFHRDEIENKHIRNIDFEYCSFRGAFIFFQNTKIVSLIIVFL